MNGMTTAAAAAAPSWQTQSVNSWNGYSNPASQWPLPAPATASSAASSSPSVALASSAAAVAARPSKQYTRKELDILQGKFYIYGLNLSDEDGKRLLHETGGDFARALKRYFELQAVAQGGEEEGEEGDSEEVSITYSRRGGSSQGGDEYSTQEEKMSFDRQVQPSPLLSRSSTPAEKQSSSPTADGAAASAVNRLPPRTQVRVISDSGLERVYGYNTSKPLRKLFDAFVGESKRELEFEFNGSLLTPEQSLIDIGFNEGMTLKARAPRNKKRRFELSALSAASSTAPAAAATAADQPPKRPRNVVESSSAATGTPITTSASSALPPTPAPQASSAIPAPAAGAAAAQAAASDYFSPEPAFSSSWSELSVGIYEFAICHLQKRASDRAPVEPPKDLTPSLLQFVSELRVQEWTLTVPRGDYDENHQPIDKAARKDQIHTFFSALKYACHSEALKGYLRVVDRYQACDMHAVEKCEAGCALLPHYTLRCYISLVPAGHNKTIPRGNVLLPLLSSAFRDVVHRHIHAPVGATDLHSLLELSVRTKFAPQQVNAMQDDEEEEDLTGFAAEVEEKSNSSKSGGRAKKRKGKGSRKGKKGSTSAAIDEGDSAYEKLQRSWKLPSESSIDELLCPQTESLLTLSAEELSHKCGLNVTLRDYQMQTVLWAYRQECRRSAAECLWVPVNLDESRAVWYSPWLEAVRFEPLPSNVGGMICDVMGLGKTVSMMALMQLNDAQHASIMDAHTLLSSPAAASSPSARISAPDRPAIKATLVIAPTSLVGQWASELMSRCQDDRKLDVLLWYGSGRNRTLDHFRKYDVVITTNQVCSQEVMNPRGAAKSSNGSVAPASSVSILEQVEWHRIVIDESHNIKYRTTQTHQAVMRLHSKRRWLLTGTPLQTQIDDLFNQLRFLYLPILVSNFTYITAVRAHFVSRFAREADRQSHTALTCYNLLVRLIRSLVMRHTKQQYFNGRKTLISLPPRTTDVIRIQLSPEEQSAYLALSTLAKTKFDEFASQGAVVAKTMQVLSLLMPLRQACSGGPFNMDVARQQLREVEEMIRAQVVAAKADAVDARKAALATQPFNIGESCVFCLCDLEDPLMTLCRHVFCAQCLRSWLRKSSIEHVCPLCRQPVAKEDLRPPPPPPPPVPVSPPAPAAAAAAAPPAAAPASAVLPSEVEFRSKIDALLLQLQMLRNQDPTTKSLVFTQFTRTIGLVTERLKAAGFSPVVISGEMTMPPRKQALDRFNNDPDCTVFVLSMRSGGVGLTLTAATHVWILEPALNPALTAQAINRVHRLGQTKPVFCHHLVVSNSVEERIMELTKKDMEKAENDAANDEDAVDGAPALRAGAVRGESVRDLRHRELTALFQ